MENLQRSLASDSLNWVMIKHNVGLSLAEEIRASIRTGCQISALVIGVASFLIGVIVMHWISKMGMREGIKYSLTYIVLFAVIILIAKLIVYFLLWFLYHMYFGVRFLI